VLAAWRNGAGGREAKLILVCHSMGGLVARYFCEALGGADLTRRVITFGTPHRGAAKALHALGGSMRLARLINARPIAEHWPSVWEMLPQYPVLRQDGGFVHLSDSSLALADDPRFVAAQTFCRAIRDPAERRVREGVPSPYDQLVFAGRVQTTLQYLKLSDGAVLPITPGSENVTDRGGDGTVPWFAAVPIEWDETADVLPLLDKHTALATREIAIEHLLNRLAPTDVSGDKAPELGPDATDLSAVGYALDVPPVVDAGEPVVIRVVHPTLSAVPLEITDHERGDRRFFDEARSTGEAEARGFVLEVDLGPLPPGAYTVRTQLSPSVSDHVLVWSESLVP
jgi:pimeloyl-ACP methyl ester carboxylesterase